MALFFFGQQQKTTMLFLTILAATAPLSQGTAPLITLTSPAAGSNNQEYFSDFNILLTFDQTVTSVDPSKTLEVKEGSPVLEM